MMAAVIIRSKMRKNSGDEFSFSGHVQLLVKPQLVILDTSDGNIKTPGDRRIVLALQAQQNDLLLPACETVQPTELLHPLREVAGGPAQHVDVGACKDGIM